MDTNDGQRTHQSYLREIASALNNLRSKKCQIHVPRRKDLYAKIPNALFHHEPEVFIQTGGATEFSCPGANFTLQTGDICVMPRGLPHAEIPIDQADPYGVTVIGITMGDSFFIRGRSLKPGQIDSYDMLVINNQIGSTIGRYLDDISDAETLIESERRPLVSALLEAFMIRSCAALKMPMRQEALLRPRLILQAEHFSRINLGDPKLSVKRIAQALHCTPDHLSRQFHRTRQITLVQWITSERIRLAKSLLEGSHQNVTEVGWSCGFNTTSYFIRIFKQLTGITPKQYQQSAGPLKA